MEMRPYPRTRSNFEIKFRRLYERSSHTGKIKNVSLTGAFISHQHHDLISGDRVTVELEIGGQRRKITGEVIWTNSFGAGIKFVPANQKDIQMIDDLIYFLEEKKTSLNSVLGEVLKKVA